MVVLDVVKSDWSDRWDKSNRNDGRERSLVMIDVIKSDCSDRYNTSDGCDKYYRSDGRFECVWL